MSTVTTAITRTLYIFDQGLKGLGGHYYEYVRSIAEAAEAAGFRCVVGCHKQAGNGSFASFPLHPVFRDDVWATIPGEDYHSAGSMTGVSERFLEDVQKLLAKEPVKPGDIMFLPNIAKPHVVATSLVAETFGPMGVRAHFLFRYPSSHFEGATAAEAFRRLEEAATRFDVSLCTDSHRLAEDLAVLTSLPFPVFPIPHTWRGQADSCIAIDPDRPLHCVSLGNARDEKGISEILEAVRLSSQKPWGEKLRFTLQVNDPYQVEDAIEAFRNGPPDPRTTLIDEPLGSSEYAALLESADVVLVPYWRSVYKERTSGVFLEGLITGKLVLCTKDTWMSDLFDLHGGGVAVEDRSPRAICEGLLTLVQEREALQKKSRQAAAYWQAIHCPENLIAHLTGENARPAFGQLARRGKAAVLFPWGEAVSGKTGASLRLKYFVRYMEAVYDEVRILFVGGGETGGTIGERSAAEPYHYSDDAKKLHEQLKAVCKHIGVPEEDCFQLWFHLWPERDQVFSLRCEEMVLWADHVYVDYTYFVPLVDRLCREHGKNYTVTVYDIVSEQAETPFLQAAIEAVEFDAARSAPRLICASETDRSALESRGIEAELIPHPIDAQEATSPFSVEEARAILQDLYGLRQEGRQLCFFVGSFYSPNVEAAEAIAEMARQCEGDPKLSHLLFVVAGGCMKPHRTKNFAALGMIEGAGLSACMSVADVVLIPLRRGTGVSLKSIEALARGSLILSTTVGMRGIDVENGVHCCIEDDLSRFPARIAQMLADEESERRMAAAARRLGEQFDFRRLMAQYVTNSQIPELAETADQFAARRRRAIEELLPRLKDARYLSPVLSGWTKEFSQPEVAQREHAAADLLAPLQAHPADSLPASFDPDWYLGAYPDVAMLGMDPAEHYMWIGQALGRAPNAGAGRSRVTRLKSHQPASIRRTGSGRRWFLADPSLVDGSGHCARYVLSIAASLRDRGDTVHIAGNHRLRKDTVELETCEAAFTLGCEEAPFVPNADPTSRTGIARIQQRTTALLCQDLDLLAEKHAIGRSDILLINSLRHWSLEGVVEWVERRGAARAPTVAVILHYTPNPRPGVPDPAAQTYRNALKRIAHSELSSRIVLCTDSERLRAEYQALYDLPIAIVPVPHCSEPRVDFEAARDGLSIIFAGEARHDKGFDLLPLTIRQVLAAVPEGEVTFDIQAYRADERHSVGADLPVHEAVRVRTEPLSQADYESFLQHADLVMIPYLRGPYEAQTSGVYCEAAALGIPVVVPSGTWMADLVSETGAGVLFEPGDADSLAKACLSAIQNYRSLRERATRAAPGWRAFHNASNFIACLEALFEDLPAAHAA